MNHSALCRSASIYRIALVSSHRRHSLPAHAHRNFSTTNIARDQFVLYARDATDEKALERRLAVRQAHLDRAAKGKEEGVVLMGGAILSDDAERKMCGSVMVFEFPTKEAAEKYIEQDPYVKNNVWGSWTLEPFRMAKKP
ncbi:hypothetical protein HK102_002925 [Quaeritorhiza haematococci]|nr:hypothetical protein HK102_002925 [Quaeritorhiza haematococci]